MSEEINYFQIDSKNSFTTTTEEFKVNQSVKFFNKIASRQEEQIGKEINTFFSTILPNNTRDLFSINTSLSSSHQPTDAEIELSMNNILNSFYSNLQLTFDQNLINDISRILTLGINKINKHSSHYNIKTQADFNSSLFLVNYNNLDILKIYLINNINISTQLTLDLQQGNRNYNKIPFSNKKMYKYYKSDSDMFCLPNELIALVNKFQYIKKIVLQIDAIEEDNLTSYIMVLINCEWLFPNLIEVEFDLRSSNMSEVLDCIFKQELIKEMKEINKVLKTRTYETYPINFAKMQNLNNNSIINNTQDSRYHKITSKMSNLIKGFGLYSNIHRKKKNEKGDDILNRKSDDFFKLYSMKLDMIIIYSYFISKWDNNVKILKMIFPDSFSSELDVSMQQKGIKISNMNFLNFFVDFNKLISLTIQFNSLNMLNFEKVLGLIHSNFSLSILKLSLFNNERDYSPSGLFKLCNEIKKPLNQIFNERKEHNKSFINEDVDHLILWKLLHDFQINLEFLFFLLIRKNKIKEFVLIMDIPCIIVEDEKYEIVLIKFILNFFIFISCDKHSYAIVKIIAPLLLFDTRKYPIAEAIFDEIENDPNGKKPLESISTMTIQLKFFCFPQITSLITTRLTSLFIGDLDVDTFIAFVNFYTEPSFVQRSQLMMIKISLGYSLVKNYKDLKEYFVKLYRNTPEYLIQHFLLSNLTMTYMDILELLELVNYNKVLRYWIEINEQCGDFKDKNFPVCYKTSNDDMDKLKVLKEKMVMRFDKKNKGKNEIAFNRIKNFFLKKKEIIVKSKQVDDFYLN